uniref:Uncharacterized protein n=1 Tax=Octopus bimaculoides TaxID=37653 RepID=A0A0L8IHW1_OCTBM
MLMDLLCVTFSQIYNIFFWDTTSLLMEWFLQIFHGPYLRMKSREKWACM